MLIYSFSKGKNNKNEDYFGYNEECFVVADGATDKSGRKYEDKTGGEIISRLVVNETLSCNLNGAELIDYLNKKVSQIYRKLGISNDIVDPKYRFSCCCVVARIVKDKLIITSISDTAFRINGEDVYKETKQVDIDNAEKRAEYIEKTGDISGSRKYIMPLLLKQFEYQNNINHPLGYGVIDGTSTPAKFVKTFEYPKNEIKMIELFSDGYFLAPSSVSIENWEESFKKVEEEDPDKFKQYKSTKSKDDRTVIIIKFEE